MKKLYSLVCGLTVTVGALSLASAALAGEPKDQQSEPTDSTLHKVIEVEDDAFRKSRTVIVDSTTLPPREIFVTKSEPRTFFVNGSADSRTVTVERSERVAEVLVYEVPLDAPIPDRDRPSITIVNGTFNDLISEEVLTIAGQTWLLLASGDIALAFASGPEELVIYRSGQNQPMTVVGHHGVTVEDVMRIAAKANGEVAGNR